MSLELEIQETETLLTTATFDGVKTVLRGHLEKLRKLDNQQKAAAAAAAAALVSEATPKSTEVVAPVRSAPILSSSTYIPIESFAWDQGSYNSPSISVFIDLDGVGNVKDRVTVDFDKHSFDLKVLDLDGKNYRLIKDNLEKDIVPSQSSFVVKKNKVVLKLQKVKGEYSYDQWTALTGKKKRGEEEATTKKDPMGGIMDMMKNMYEDGDENMKKIIGEAMLKSQRGEKPSAPEDFKM